MRKCTILPINEIAHDLLLKLPENFAYFFCHKVPNQILYPKQKLLCKTLYTMEQFICGVSQGLQYKSIPETKKSYKRLTIKLNFKEPFKRFSCVI